MDKIMDKIEALEGVIKGLTKSEIPEDITTNHYIAGGVYEREIIVPRGFIITGKVHKTEHLAKLVSGTMVLVSTNENGELQHTKIEGPFTFVSKPGAKRAAICLTECVFSSFHFVGEERNLDVIEKMLVCDSREEYEKYLDDETKSEQLSYGGTA